MKRQYNDALIGALRDWNQDMLDESADMVVAMREALEAHMAYFEWKCSAPAEEVVAGVPDRWNAVVALTEKALGVGPQPKWRITE
jgi:hypothetical protein